MAIISVEVFIRTKAIILIKKIYKGYSFLFRVIVSKKIVDNKKEKIIRLVASYIIKIGLSFLLILFLIFLNYFIFTLLSDSFYEFILSVQGFILMFIISIGYFKLRNLFFKEA